MGISLRRAAAVLLPLWLAACGGGGAGGISFTDDQGVAAQPFPTNYRVDLLAFFKTYLNNPVGVRDAMMAEPVQRTVGGRLRYVSCVRYTAKDFDGSYTAPQERAVSYVDKRLDRIVENVTEACAGATYAPFPEMEKMTR
ncbi:hypothetical protein SFY93_23270 [Tardiphaga sp. 42S5]|nr:hypothetical protein [Tardiphaga sp. 42S5]WPO40431.1 hypothetical protein SFY93_23270 [Tardiphaga sp. 42S5]